MPKRMEILQTLSVDDMEVLLYTWDIWSRNKQKIPPDPWHTWLIQAGRGFGKMSDINDLVRTIDGWKKLGGIVDGDKIFGSNGALCNVIKAHPIQTSNCTYKLTFDTHETIICGEEHLWYTETRNERRNGKIGKGQVRTTREIANTLVHLKETNHAIPVNKPLQFQEQELLIPPYILGAWLGDGSKSSSQITNIDEGVWDEIRKCGYSIIKSNDITHNISNGSESKRNELGQFTDNGSMLSIMKRLGIYKDKRIPWIYMNSSYEQRLSLLQGLMDTDGYCGKNGWCDIALVKEDLMDDIFELIGSLGIKVHRHKGGRRMLNGQYYGEKDKIFFKTFTPVFKLSRKLERQMAAPTAQYRRQQFRFIVSAEIVDNIPLRCLTVDSEDHLFLIGKSFVPTHNTRTGAETIRQWKEQGYGRFALIAETPADARDVMIEGQSGLIEISPPWDKPVYQPSKRRVTWNNGAMALIFSGANPEQLRGPQHEKAWCDEIFAWQYPQETWDMLMFGLRLGDNPQVVVTSTPKPSKLIKSIRAKPTTHITMGTTYENRANLAASFMTEVVSMYEGTRLGRQELNAEILDDNPNALWTRSILDDTRVIKPPSMKRIVVAVDPSATSSEDANETGIIVCGLGSDNEGYTLEDCTIKGTPAVWGAAAIAAYYKYKADRIIAETNQGGEMVKNTILTIDKTVPFKGVHATKGKYTRAEPISALYEQRKIHHVGTHGRLEDQLCEWELGMDSPDRLDALVWGFTDLMISTRQLIIAAPEDTRTANRWRT